jgi:hypothetical protein
LDGSVYDDNDIVFCETCNVPVHQFCYGIETVPEGEWCVRLLLLLCGKYFFLGKDPDKS